MKIGVIIPNRPGREMFAPIWEAYLRRQTLEPSVVLDMCEPYLGTHDLVERVARGLELSVDFGVDAVAIIENDDWYSPRYLEVLAKAWRDCGRPHLFGAGTTIYYNLKNRTYSHMVHDGRASLFCTIISAEAIDRGIADDCRECPDNFLDLHLWNMKAYYKKTTLALNGHALGLKHGVGYAGGNGHSARLKQKDENLRFLHAYIGKDVANYFDGSTLRPEFNV